MSRFRGIAGALVVAGVLSLAAGGVSPAVATTARNGLGVPPKPQLVLSNAVGAPGWAQPLMLRTNLDPATHYLMVSLKVRGRWMEQFSRPTHSWVRGSTQVDPWMLAVFRRPSPREPMGAFIPGVYQVRVSSCETPPVEDASCEQSQVISSTATLTISARDTPYYKVVALGPTSIGAASVAIRSPLVNGLRVSVKQGRARPVEVATSPKWTAVRLPHRLVAGEEVVVTYRLSAPIGWMTATLTRVV